MRFLLSLILILALPSCGTAPSAAEDEAAARDAMLALLAAGERNRLAYQMETERGESGLYCIAPRTEESPSRFEAGEPNIHLDAEWTLVAVDGGNGRTIVNPALTRAANAARHAVLPSRALMAPGESLPAPLRPGGPGQNCANVTAMSAPSIQGDFAFIEIVNFCGDNCAGSTLYALRRQRGGWRPHATLPGWVT